MSQSGEAAEQIVDMAANVTVKSVECASNFAGKGAMSLTTFLIVALKDQKRTKGKMLMQAFCANPPMARAENGGLFEPLSKTQNSIARDSTKRPLVRAQIQKLLADRRERKPQCGEKALQERPSKTTKSRK